MCFSLKNRHKMLKILHFQYNLINKATIHTIFKRNFLSNAYKCSEVWDKRLKSPHFQKVNLDEIYFQLSLAFKKKEKFNVLDVDMFCSAVKDFQYRNEMEDILYNVRQWPECGILPERTTHAVIRIYLEHGATSDIFHILGDRLSFGIFPDYYLTNILLDKFLKEEDVIAAVKIAVLQMLQEDFNNEIMKPLALYSCFKYLNSPCVWESVKEIPDPDEEVQKVRVSIVRNPYFDDHFDITDTNHLVGKTLWLFGMHVNNSVGVSSQLVGLALYEKYEKAVLLLENIINNDVKVYVEAVEKAKNYALSRPKEEKQEISESDKKEEASQAKHEADKRENIGENVDTNKIKFLELLEKIQEKNLIQKDLLSETEKLVKEAIQNYEKQEIDHQCQVYRNWEEEREKHIKFEIDRCEQEKIKAEIEKAMKELKSEEEKLFYFEKEEEIENIAEKVAIEQKKEFVYKYSKKELQLFKNNKDPE